ncbi:hypothetical protein M758_12G104500 [Ceratodon purpureus]|nr:hypothetical protein M758_12G104500 [Ceratodon purpureus]
MVPLLRLLCIGDQHYRKNGYVYIGREPGAEYGYTCKYWPRRLPCCVCLPLPWWPGCEGDGNQSACEVWKGSEVRELSPKCERVLLLCYPTRGVKIGGSGFTLAIWGKTRASWWNN